MNKYFTTYAEPEVQLLPFFQQEHTALTTQFSQVVCIPFFDENLEWLTSLATAAQQYAETETSLPRLLILTINRAEKSEPCRLNKQAVDHIKSLPQQWVNQYLSLHYFSDNLSIILIDRSTEHLIPIKQGVGLARKIACDIAAYLVEQHIVTNPVFMSSDADVIFPENYFSGIHDAANALHKNHAAFIFNYQHINSVSLCDDSQHQAQQTAIHSATLYYERSLRDYEAGLSAAGSPYAYQTIGSCIAIETNAYIQVRGFPKRSAGEDFYLLNKLNKLKPVKTLQAPTLGIQSRISQRVPFGTGPAVEKLLAGNSALFYAPICFVLLGDWIKYLSALAECNNLNDLNQGLALPFHKPAYFSDTVLVQLFETLNTEKFARQCLQQHKSAEKRMKAYHDWFDGFKTLKAIHLFSETYPKHRLDD